MFLRKADNRDQGLSKYSTKKQNRIVLLANNRDQV